MADLVLVRDADHGVGDARDADEGADEADEQGGDLAPGRHPAVPAVLAEARVVDEALLAGAPAGAASAAAGRAAGTVRDRFRPGRPEPPGPPGPPALRRPPRPCAALRAAARPPYGCCSPRGPDGEPPGGPRGEPPAGDPVELEPPTGEPPPAGGPPAARRPPEGGGVGCWPPRRAAARPPDGGCADCGGLRRCSLIEQLLLDRRVRLRASMTFRSVPPRCGRVGPHCTKDHDAPQRHWVPCARHGEQSTHGQKTHGANVHPITVS